jgi:transmembrane sensor
MDSLTDRFANMENASRTGYLIGSFITGTLTIEEREELDAWVVQREENMQLFEDMTDEKQVNRFMEWLARREVETKLADSKKRIKFKQHRRVVLMWRWAAAACSILLLGIGIYYVVHDSKIKSGGKEEQLADIEPGTSLAKLKLPGGKIVQLDISRDTAIGDITIKGGEIKYAGDNIDIGMHEISIPRKGSYKLVLHDGTKIWLNNESSIRYPGLFATDQRKVSVTGEVYIEVVHDSARPFVIETDQGTVTDIGTAFNINMFEKKVTVTEGIIKLSTGQYEKKVGEGEQVSWENGKIDKVEIDPVISWKDNRFHFRNSTLNEIIPQLERWYDVKAIYKDSISYHFNGTIDRSVPLSRVLKLLEGTEEAHFKIDGNNIIINK